MPSIGASSPPLSSPERSSSLDGARNIDAGEVEDEEELCSSPSTSPCSSVHVLHRNRHIRAAVGTSLGGGSASVGGGRKASVSLQLFKESADDQLDLSPPAASTANNTFTADVKGTARTASPSSPNLASIRSSHSAPSPRHSIVKVTAASSTPKSSRSSPSSSRTSLDHDRQLADLSLPPPISFPLPQSAASTSSYSTSLPTTVPPARQRQPQNTNRLVPSEIIDTHAALPSGSTLSSSALESQGSVPPSENHQRDPGRYRNHQLPQMNASLSDSVPLRRKSFKIVSSPLTKKLPYYDQPIGRKGRVGAEGEVDWVDLDAKEEGQDGKRPFSGDDVVGINRTSTAEASSATSWGTTLFGGEGEDDSWVGESADELDLGLDDQEGQSALTDESEGGSYDYELQVGSMDIGSLSSSPTSSRADYVDPRCVVRAHRASIPSLFGMRAAHPILVLSLRCAF
jgi:hypothetical protein